jgi:hypothetical protein
MQRTHFTELQGRLCEMPLELSMLTIKSPKSLWTRRSNARHKSHVTRHTSHVTRHTSHVTRHTSHVNHLFSKSKAPLRIFSSVTRPCRLLSFSTSRDTITRHTSHVTRHTSHATHHHRTSPSHVKHHAASPAARSSKLCRAGECQPPACERLCSQGAGGWR